MQPPPQPIGLIYSHELEGQAKLLSEQYKFIHLHESNNDSPSSNDPLTLTLNPKGLSLHDHTTGLGGLHIDFCDPKTLYKLNHGGGKQQPLPKAIGLKKKPSASIIDATCGLGQDTLLLAHLGATVTAIECNPILFLLLEDALERAKDHPDLKSTIGRISLMQGEASTLIPELPSHDVIYLDPMFPKNKKSAKVKKDMQFLQHFINHQPDTAQLLSTARRYTTWRVVVKRAKLSPYIGDKTPTFSSKGQSNRFDIYQQSP